MGCADLTADIRAPGAYTDGTMTDAIEPATVTTNAAPTWRTRFATLRKRRIVSWAMELGLIAVVIVGISAYQARHLPEGAAPALDVATLDGGHFSIDSLRGTTTMVVFWAPWCGVCAAESDNLKRAQELVGDRARIVTVAAEYDSVDDVRAFVDKHGITAPVGLGGKTAARRWRVGAFPTAFILDKDGVIVSRMVGYTSTPGMVARLLAP